MLLAYAPAADHALARHGGRVIALRAQLGIVSEDAPRSDVHIATFGEWGGHPAGPFALDAKAFGDIVKNFDRQKNPVPVVIGHPIDTAPAVGWIQRLEVRGDGSNEGDGLWALVEWTEKTASSIRSGEWRFCSGVFVFGSTDRVTGDDVGAELLELGLTNSPFIDGQVPLSLSRRASGAGARRLSMDPEKMIAGVAKALGLDPGTSKEKVVSMLEAIYSFLGAMSGDEASTIEEKAATDAELSRKVVDTAKLVRKLSVDLAEGEGASASDAAAAAILTKLLEATGMDEAGVLAAVTSNIDAIAKLLTAQPASGGAEDAAAAAALTRSATELSATQARVKALELSNKAMSEQLASIETEKIKALVDEAVKLGHILESDRETFVELARTSRSMFDRMLSSASARPAVPAGRITKTSVDASGKAVATTHAEKVLLEKYTRLGASEQTKCIALDLHRAQKGQ